MCPRKQSLPSPSPWPAFLCATVVQPNHLLLPRRATRRCHRRQQRPPAVHAGSCCIQPRQRHAVPGAAAACQPQHKHGGAARPAALRAQRQAAGMQQPHGGRLAPRERVPRKGGCPRRGARPVILPALARTPTHTSKRTGWGGEDKGGGQFGVCAQAHPSARADAAQQRQHAWYSGFWCGCVARAGSVDTLGRDGLGHSTAGRDTSGTTD